MKKQKILSKIFGIGLVLVLVASMLVGLTGISSDITNTSIAYASSYDVNAAVNYADARWNSRNPAYHDYSSEGGDCANYVSQCLIAGGLDLSVHPGADAWGCIPSTANLHDYLANYLGATWETRPKSEVEPLWFVAGDVAIFRKSGLTKHSVFAVDVPYWTTCNAHSYDQYHKEIQFFFDNSDWDSCTYYHISTTTVQPPSPPTLSSPSNGATGVSLTPTFQWSSVSNADYYGLYISEPPYGSSHLVYDNDGPIYGTSLTLPSGILTNEVKYCWNMRAHNSAGWGGFSSSWYFTTEPAPNQAPTCSLSANPTSGNVPLDVTFTMSANDPDGSISVWGLDADGDASFDYSGAGNPPPTQPHTYTTSGTYIAAFMVLDNDGANCWKTVTIVAGENKPPTCSLSPSPSSGKAPLAVTFSISASDPDGWISSWELNPDDGSPIYSDTGNPPSTKAHTYTAAGTYTAILGVTDNEGATRFDNKVINVDPPDLPTIAFSPSSFSFTATEGESNPLSQPLSIWNSGGETLSWSVSDNATWLGLSPTSGSSTGETDEVTVSVDISGMSAGSYESTITISAPEATNTPQTVLVNLAINPASGDTSPDTSITDGPSGTIDYNDVTFTWTGSDDVTPTSELVYSYYLEGYDSSWSDWRLDTTTSYYGLSEGSYTFKVKAKDQANHIDPTPAEVLFTVSINQPPKASFTYSPESPRSGDVVSFDASSSFDLDEDEEIVAYEWDFGDGENAIGCYVTHRFRGQMHASKTYDVSLIVKDNRGALDESTIQITVKGLKRIVEVKNIASTPLEADAYARVTVWYYWIGTEGGEDIYMVTDMSAEASGFCGYYTFFLMDVHSQPKPLVIWWDLRSSLQKEGWYYYPFDTGADPIVSRVFPNWEPRTPEIRHYGDNEFRGFVVRGSDAVQIRATGVPSQFAMGTDPRIVALSVLSKLFFKEDTRYFQPDNTDTRPLPIDINDFNAGALCSPGELRVYDSQGRVIGLVNGEIEQQIPNSSYFNNSFVVFSPRDCYLYQVVGTSEGTYGLVVVSVKDGELATATITDIATAPNATDNYTIDLQGFCNTTKLVVIDETISTNPPNIPDNPSPAEGEGNVPVNSDLGWNCSDPDGDNLTYYVYIGTDENPPLVSENQTGTAYSSSLNHGSTYYWRVIARDEHGVATESPVWSFTTHSKSGDGGGGGGASRYYLSLDIMGIASKWLTNYYGNLRENVEAVSEDGKLAVYMSEDTLCRDEGGKRIDTIVVSEETEIPAVSKNHYIIGKAYKLEPEGTRFAPPLKLTLGYDDIPQYVSEEDIYIAYYNATTGSWIPLTSQVDTQNNEVSSQVSHFTTFAIIGIATPPTPAEFTIAKLDISNEQVQPGEPVTVSAEVINVGGCEGNYTVVLKINEVIEASEDVWLAVDESREVSFEVIMESCGNYSVEVNGLEDSFTVKEPVTEPINWPLIGGVIAGIGLGIFFLVRRRMKKV